MNNKLIIGVVGYGYWGPNIVRQLIEHDRFNLTFICDKNQSQLEIARKRYGDKYNLFNDYTNLIQRNEIDAVAIAVDTPNHFEVAHYFLSKGIHIFVEKPIVTNLEEYDELELLAKKNSCIIHVDHIMIFHPAIIKIKEIIDSGELGQIKTYESSRMNLGRAKKNQTPLWDLSIHDVSILTYFFGNLELLNSITLDNNHNSQSTTYCNSFLIFKNLIATIKSSWESPIKERILTIVGDKKMIIYNDMESVNKLIIYDKGLEFEPNLSYDKYVLKNREGDGKIIHFNHYDALENSLSSFEVKIKKGCSSRIVIDHESQTRLILLIMSTLEKNNLRTFNKKSLLF